VTVKYSQHFCNICCVEAAQNYSPLFSTQVSPELPAFMNGPVRDMLGIIPPEVTWKISTFPFHYIRIANKIRNLSWFFGLKALADKFVIINWWFYLLAMWVTPYKLHFFVNCIAWETLQTVQYYLTIKLCNYTETNSDKFMPD